jgi:3-hydroxyisobutyrate dehydrogenase-like beta-hydroxyacid dehydrogenase
MSEVTPRTLHTERVGFVGLGTMGSFMAASLVRAGFPLAVWNRVQRQGE